MTITVSKTALSDAVNILSQALPKKITIPILGDFHCKVEDKMLEITASDSEITIRKSIVLHESTENGAFCMNANLIKNALSELPEEPITLKVEGDRIVVTHQTGNFHFPILNPNPDEYPALLSDLEVNTNFDMDSGKVIDAISRCMWATETSDLRPALCGVCFNISKGYLEVVASNGLCIVKSRIKALTAPDDLNGKFVLPKKAAMLLAKMKKYDDFCICYDEKRVMIETDDIAISISLVDAKYPDYNKVFPSGTRPTALINRYMLINSIKKVAPFTNESSNMVRLSFSKDALVINAEDYDFGIGATDAFNVDYKGDDIAFGMKSSGLLKSLQIMKTDNLFMEFTDDSHAVTLTYESPDENDQVDILLMPMLLNN